MDNMIGWVVLGALFISGLKDLGKAIAASLSGILSLAEYLDEKNENKTTP